MVHVSFFSCCQNYIFASSLAKNFASSLSPTIFACQAPVPSYAPENQRPECHKLLSSSRRLTTRQLTRFSLDPSPDPGSVHQHQPVQPFVRSSNQQICRRLSVRMQIGAQRQTNHLVLMPSQQAAAAKEPRCTPNPLAAPSGRPWASFPRCSISVPRNDAH